MKRHRIAWIYLSDHDKYNYLSVCIVWDSINTFTGYLMAKAKNGPEGSNPNLILNDSYFYTLQLKRTN